MRWSIIRIIWLRELRDQLRDRRTLFMVAGLPLLLYPILGIVVLKFAVSFVDKTTTVGVVTLDRELREFPPRPRPSTVQTVVGPLAWLTLTPSAPGSGLALDRAIGTAALAESSRNVQAPATSGLSPLPFLAWFTAAPAVPGSTGLERVAGTAALAEYSHVSHDYPVLICKGKFAPPYLQPSAGFHFVLLGENKVQIEWFTSVDQAKRALVDTKKIDLLLSAPPDFWAALDNGQPIITLNCRDNDENSRLAVQRLHFILARWKKHIKEVRFARKQLPAHFDDPFSVHDPRDDQAGQGSRNVLDMLVRIFPFMLVMWSLAGALYPAVDLCAGEKERGTMETLLISPASREEIVWGKFLTIWVFSAGTALLNLLSMGITTWSFSSQLPRVELTAVGLFWCVLLLLPLAAFFSAVCLAIGAYARSSKEGQYYLMPLFLITMPLIFVTLAPGVELNSFYSMVPVTGVALLMQRLLTTSAFEQPWFYFVSVMAPTALYSWLALRWAIDQFQREEVLFREAERIDLRLWLRRLLRDKETRPTTGQALFCFGLLLALRWLSESLGQEMPLLARSGIIVAAFVAAPPLFMALLLTTRPRQVLAAWWPAWPYLAAALLLLPLMAWMVSLTLRFPRLLQLLQERQTLVEQAFAGKLDRSLSWAVSVLLLAFVTAAGKEIAFRGYIFAGLLRRMRPWPAILVSSFLFAAFHMNVFLLPPLFLLGVALGTLALRSGSLLPGIILHGSCYALLLFRSAGRGGATTADVPADAGLWQYAVTASCTLAAAVLLWWQNRRTGSGFFEALLAVPKPITPAAPEPDGSRTPARMH
jgi:sodium transport system permease protein